LVCRGSTRPNLRCELPQASLLWLGQRRPRGRRCRRPGKFRRGAVLSGKRENTRTASYCDFVLFLGPIESGDRNGGRDHFKYRVRAADVALRAFWRGPPPPCSAGPTRLFPRALPVKFLRNRRPPFRGAVELTRRRTGGARRSLFTVLSDDAKQRIPHLRGFLCRVFTAPASTISPREPAPGKRTLYKVTDPYVTLIVEKGLLLCQMRNQRE
jgi:hypothetical protein